MVAGGRCHHVIHLHLVHLVARDWYERENLGRAVVHGYRAAWVDGSVGSGRGGYGVGVNFPPGRQHQAGARILGPLPAGDISGVTLQSSVGSDNLHGILVVPGQMISCLSKFACEGHSTRVVCGGGRPAAGGAVGCYGYGVSVGGPAGVECGITIIVPLAILSVGGVIGDQRSVSSHDLGTASGVHVVTCESVPGFGMRACDRGR